MIFLTYYIYPIQTQITISKKLGFSLDNARTEEELPIIKKYIESTLNSPNEVFRLNYVMRIPTTKKKNDTSSFCLKDALDNFKRCYSETDPYVKKVFQENENSDPVTLLAKIWIIAKFEVDISSNEKDKTEPIFIYPGEVPRLYTISKNHPLLKKSEELISYTFLISLLINTEKESYNGDSFIIHNHMMDIYFPTFDINLNHLIVHFGMNSFKKEFKDEKENWTIFHHVKKNIVITSNLIDSAITTTSKEKIFYISDSLRTINKNINDERMKLVALVGIIELILTRQVSNQGEDSVSKQFRCKASKVIYNTDKSINLNDLRKRLKIIYQQRSNIAHGNMQKLKDFIRKEQRRINQEKIIESINLELYGYIRIIIWEYLRNSNFIDQLQKKKKIKNCV